MAKKLTKKQAEAALKVIAKKFGADNDYGPSLIKDYQGWYSDYAWAIVWEEGPYEWPMLLDGGFDDELFQMLYPEFEPDINKASMKARRSPAVLPAGVWAEPINHYSLALHPV